ncbi:MAG: hypothetical protein AAB263_19605 [Planctomycetota bacterium]
MRVALIIAVILLFFLYPASYGVWRRTRCEMFVRTAGEVKFFMPRPSGKPINEWEYQLYYPLLVSEVWIHGGKRETILFPTNHAR